MLYNTNGLIREASDEYFDGAYGVKTGTSNQAGCNLVSDATRRECLGDAPCINRDALAVALGSADDETVAGDRFSDSRKPARVRALRMNRRLAAADTATVPISTLAAHHAQQADAPRNSYSARAPCRQLSWCNCRSLLTGRPAGRARGDAR